MSNKDYTKYAKASDPIVDDIADVVTEPEVTPEPVVEQEVAPVIEPESKPVDNLPTPADRKLGYVSGCTKLNVRAAAKFDANIICEIHCGTEVEINEEESSGDYYKVCTSSGIEGFCMKTYITVE